ncbi:AAA family ATPase [Candidatus Rariloculus sp.]|uniref:AAA family ATPase n=1 Tax=Candidatus Rariloculus sp. TaxID=3101265 RepID=UPI003D1039E9
MHLKSVQVTNFRSVDDSGAFELAPVTCLVGKNEAGKSAILLALAALNPHDATPVLLDRERDYPRRLLTQYDSTHGDQGAVAISTTWELTDPEMQAITDQVGQGVLKSNLVSVVRRYGKEVEINPDLDYRKAVELLYQRFALNAPERSALGSPSTTSALKTALNALESPTPKHQGLLQHLQQHGSVIVQACRLIQEMLPSFMYVSSYDRMDGAIQLEQTNNLIQNNQLDRDDKRGARLFCEFLEYAGVSIDEIVGVQTYETFNAKLQAASNNITDQILEYWTQNPDLDVLVRVERALPGDPPPLNSGTIARARIVNQLHRVDTPFSERSAGFVWFFSFLVKFAQIKDDDSPVVLLLDEPGLSLHGKAQGDLLRFFEEKLAPHHQIVYSTHSPFMVPASAFDRVRIVEDKVEVRGQRRIPLGTKVREDILELDPDTLFPLQGALGYEITQSLFVGEHTLLVEGPSDVLYLHALSAALRARNRNGLDNRWTLCPAGGIDKIMPFVSLFAGNDLHVAVLSDQSAGDKRKLERITKSGILQAGHLYSIIDFIDGPEGDVEDLFDPEYFVHIVNECYALDESLALTIDKVKCATGTTRIVKRVEALFRLLPDTVPVFNHFAPASWLIRNPRALEESTEAVERSLAVAERVFEKYNSLL